PSRGESVSAVYHAQASRGPRDRRPAGAGGRRGRPHPTRGIECREPPAAGAREAVVSGGREVVRPREGMETRAARPRDAAALIRRARVDHDDLVDQWRHGAEAAVEDARLVLDDEARRQEDRTAGPVAPRRGASP